jgi:hypothetical protein
MGERMYRSMFFFLPRQKLEAIGELHAPADLLPGKELLFPLDKRLGGTRSRSGQCGEVKFLYSSWTRLDSPFCLDDGGSMSVDSTGDSLSFDFFTWLKYKEGNRPWRPMGL